VPYPARTTSQGRLESRYTSTQPGPLRLRQLTSRLVAPADSAWAAADLLTTVAAVTGTAELDEAAEEFTRAARAAWGRVPTPTPNGQMLRTAAYLIASCRRSSHHVLARAVRVLLTALASLARTLAKLRTAQARPQQATAAAAAATRLVGLAATIDYGETVPDVAAIAFPRSPQVGRSATAAKLAPRSRPRAHARGHGLSV
jgi:hypothetical protein